MYAASGVNRLDIVKFAFDIYHGDVATFSRKLFYQFARYYLYSSQE